MLREAVRFLTVPGQDYLVERTTDLIGFAPLTETFTATGPTTTVTDDAPASGDRAFYRISRTVPEIAPLRGASPP